jgi:hypothetical protein
MSDPATNQHALTVLVEELSAVTPAMIEAGSRAAEQAAIVRPGVARQTSEAQYLAAIWRAMLAAKLAR